MEQPSNYKAVKKIYDSLGDDIKSYFNQAEILLTHEDIGLDVCLAYLFLRIEAVQNRALFGALSKLHRVDTKFARRLLNMQHITRDGYLSLFKNIFGHELSDETTKLLNTAKKVRDRLIHGKSVSEAELRTAIVDCFKYSIAFKEEIYKISKFSPFSDMRGVKGRGKSLSPTTSKWIMRGLGFGVRP